MRKRVLLSWSVLLLCAAAGCGGTQTKRLEVNEIKDISGKWNDTDSRLVAEEMIKDCLAQPWLAKARGKKGGEPTVIIGTVRNQSHEHINTDTFIEDIQRALINSGQIEFVASKGERGDVRDERLDQDTNSSEETRKAHGQETGADFMLTGAINTIQDSGEGTSVMLYQTNLKLVDMQSHKIAWNGQKKLKKQVKRSKVGF